jgi:hypothetical protein
MRSKGGSMVGGMSSVSSGGWVEYLTTVRHLGKPWTKMGTANPAG